LKRSILYYSDCNYFAGCENMIAHFLNSELILNNFDISIGYNFSEEYEQGLNQKVSTSGFSKYPLKLKKQPFFKSHTTYPLLIQLVLRFFEGLYINLYKYYSVFINTILLIRFYKKLDIDILHINNGGYPAAYSCYSAVIAAKICGIKKIIYVVNNIASDYKRPSRWLDYPLDFIIKRWVTIFITGSEHAGEMLKKVLNLEDKKYLKINNGAEIQKITITKEEFKGKYKIPRGRLIGSVGAILEKNKGHIFLLQAILKMKNQYANDLIPFFIFAGSGSEKNNLERYIVRNELTDNVLMIDYIPDIYNLLNASDFVILPSICNEDFPFIVIEAMSLGKPVIGTYIAGMPEQIVNGRTGILVKPNNSEEIYQALISLLFNPKIINLYSENAKIRFYELFELDICLKKYYNLYSTI